jgi:Ca2+-binding RTX toxin-like protein
MATMVVVAAGVALAAVVIGKDTADDCAMLAPKATAAADDITLAGGDDTCDGLGGGDVIHGDSGGDDITGNTGRDHLYGGGGASDTVDGGATAGDWVSVVDGDTDDTAMGGPGNNDKCVVDDANEAVAAPDPDACEKIYVATLQP